MLTDKQIAEYFKTPRRANFLIHSGVIEGTTGTYFETKFIIHGSGEAYPSLIALLRCAGIKFKESPGNGKNVIIHIPKLPIAKAMSIAGRKKYVFQYVPKPQEQIDHLKEKLTDRLRAVKEEGPTKESYRELLSTCVRLSFSDAQAKYNQSCETFTVVDL